jgi:hypothetical protein
MVIQPGDTATLDDPDMILIFLPWTDFSTDAFQTFLDVATSHADAAALSMRLIHRTPPTSRRPLRSALIDCTLGQLTIPLDEAKEIFSDVLSLGCGSDLSGGHSNHSRILKICGDLRNSELCQLVSRTSAS